MRDPIERRMPASTDTAFEALRAAVERRFTVKSTDDVEKTVHFSSKASLFSWGENFTAQVVPSGAESTVRVRWSGREPGLWADIVAALAGAGSAASTSTGKAQTARVEKLVTALFDDVSGIVRSKRTSA